MAPAYATVQDVRNAGISDPPTDATVTAAIDFASRLADAYAGPFGGSTAGAVAVDDVRGDLVPLPYKPRSISAVRLGTYTYPTTNYELVPGGIRFAGHLSTYRLGRGETITVEGDFTADVSPLVTEAVVELVKERFSAADSGSIPELPGNVSSLSVEGLSVSYRAAGDGTEGKVKTTGNPRADQLLDLAARTKGGDGGLDVQRPSGHLATVRAGRRRRGHQWPAARAKAAG